MINLLPAFLLRRPPERVVLLQEPPLRPDGQFEQRARIVPRNAADRAVKIGGTMRWWRDLYHQLLVLPWGTFLIILATVYLAANVVFATLYLADPGGIAHARAGSFGDAFFFSIQTMATIGYGVLYPQDLYTNLLVTAETLLSIIIVAFATGLFFARFSRPSARVRFAKCAVISDRNGVPTLMIRAVNGRSNQILQADVELTLLKSETSSEGVTMRRFNALKLERAHTPVFALSFTLMHAIDVGSPLHNMNTKRLKEENAELLVTVTGLDETMSQTIHARHSYVVDELMFGYRYKDIFGYLPDGRVAIDLHGFDEIVAALGADDPPPPDQQQSGQEGQDERGANGEPSDDGGGERFLEARTAR